MTPNAQTETLAAAVLRKLSAQLKQDTNCITSKECLKTSVLCSHYVEHFTQLLVQQHPHLEFNYASFLAQEAFNDAVDTIYA